MMKLYDIINQQYVLTETEYGIMDTDTSHDDDDYCLSLNGKTSLLKLKESAPNIYERISKEAEDVQCEEENIDIYEGTVTSVSGTESCMVYAPDFWQ